MGLKSFLQNIWTRKSADHINESEKRFTRYTGQKNFLQDMWSKKLFTRYMGQKRMYTVWGVKYNVGLFPDYTKNMRKIF